MIDNIVAVHKDRMRQNTWLSAETKEKAIEKLNKMTYFVGYPKKVSEHKADISIDPKASLLDNLSNITKATISYNFEHFNDPVDKTEWNAPSYVVNAFYQPTNNSITFPAAILQDVFYDDKQSLAANYGDIGAVIGHEITHAFDNNGALYDASGNLSNWWTDDDYKGFEDKTQAMVKLFDGQKVTGGKVNGALTVSENIADAGGLSVALEALKNEEPSANLKAFFENYAKSCREKSTKAYAKLILQDVHAPSSLRVNLQVNLIPEFYDTYKVKKGDKMYLPENKRVHIW